MGRSRSNFYRPSVADFRRADAPLRPPDHVSHTGSSYWYADDGVFRESDHWGFGIGSSDWFIEGCAHGFGVHASFVDLTPGRECFLRVPFLDDDEESMERVCGFCPWEGFTAKPS